MSKSPPIKHKCVDCGHEEWIVLYECCCYDICSCGSPKCTKCGHLTVPKRQYGQEIITSIEYALAQIIEYDDNLHQLNTANNRYIQEIQKDLKKLKEMS